MCDYSLHNVRNRLAVEGEPLQIHRFPSGSLGLASQNDLRPLTAGSPVQTIAGWWQAMKNWFVPSLPLAAVCVPPGAQLVLREIPRGLHDKFGVSSEEVVTFVQLSPETIGYRDAVRFQNGKEILIQRLPVGLRLDVLGLSAHEEDGQQTTPMDIQLALASSS